MVDRESSGARETAVSRFLLPTAPLDLEGAHRRYLEALLGPRAVCSCCGGTDRVRVEGGVPVCYACGREHWVDGPIRPAPPIDLFNDKVPACGCCGSIIGVELEYPWDGTGEDPNAPILLCRGCAQTHHAGWDDGI
jgi:hypothetical protein